MAEGGGVSVSMATGEKASKNAKKLLYGSFVQSAPVEDEEKDYSVKITDEELVQCILTSV
jgi:hypothetical protein